MSRAADSPAPRSIASGEELYGLLEQARTTGRLALDTEFMGEGRYRTLLCLIQLRDPPGLRSGGTDRAGRPAGRASDGSRPLAELLDDPEVELVVHAGPPGHRAAAQALGWRPRNVFDTQLAAGFVGMPAQSSYESLLAGLLGHQARQERELHALGRTAAVPRAAGLRPRGRGAPARARR